MPTSISPDIARVLTKTYYRVCHTPGWAARIAAKAPAEWVEYMERLDERMQPVYAAIDAWGREIFRNFGHEIALEDDENEKVKKLSARIFDVYQHIGGLIDRDAPYGEILFTVKVSRLREMEKLRTGIRTRQLFRGNREGSDAATDAEILEARKVPLEAVCGPLERGAKILCPFHADKNPSMYVKNGFGYCFSCHEWCDSIRYVRTVDGMSFKEAVKYVLDRR
jgi:hypothetical protein